MGMLDKRVGVILDSRGSTCREIALLMAREGARVVLNDAGKPAGETGENGFTAEEVAHAVRESGGEALACSESVDSWDGSHRLMQGAVDRFGQIDILVNNVALSPGIEQGILDEISRETWKRTLRSRLKATFCCTRAVLAHMRPQRRGSLIHFLPAAGLIGGVGQAHEGAVMMAIAGFSRNVAIETERVPITSNCIATHAGTRPLTEAAPLAVFLASEAAGKITGQLFGVRGKEIYLYSQARIARSIHHSQGWTVDELACMIEPAMGASFTSLDTVDSCFSWDAME